MGPPARAKLVCPFADFFNFFGSSVSNNVAIRSCQKCIHSFCFTLQLLGCLECVSFVESFPFSFLPSLSVWLLVSIHSIPRGSLDRCRELLPSFGVCVCVSAVACGSQMVFLAALLPSCIFILAGVWCSIITCCHASFPSHMSASSGFCANARKAPWLPMDTYIHEPTPPKCVKR